MSISIKKESDITMLLMYITVVVTVLSQVEAISRFVRPLMYAAWGLMMIVSFFGKGRKSRFSLFTMAFSVLYLCFALFCIVCTLFGRDHLHANMLTVLVIPLIVTVVTNMSLNSITRQQFFNLALVYVSMALVFAVYVNIMYFPSLQAWFSSRMYAFMNKNSAAQIWSLALLLLFFVIIPQLKRYKIVGYAAIVYLIFVSGLSQCRTALLGVALVLVFYFFRLPTKQKLIVLGVTLALAVIILSIPTVRNYLSHTFLLDKYGESSDVNDISSGRIKNYERAFDQFKEASLIGTGRYYVDNFYICVLTENGVIGALIIYIIWGLRISQNIAVNRQYNTIKGYRKDMIIGITILYFVESVLEGYPPFGPGVSSFMFWLLCSLDYRKIGACEEPV
ncbi:MAG: O-antigen ligase family protein [Clostridia bacterium]|nr:O-antigen ligase family protein [Clostridia bacterium]